MKAKIFIITIVCGLLAANETFAQNNGTGGDSSPSPGTAPGGAINKPRKVEPGLNHAHVAHPTNSNNGFRRGAITNGVGSGSRTNGGPGFTNGLGSGAWTNRMIQGGLTNNGHGHRLVHTNSNGRIINPHNLYANDTNPYSAYTNKNAPYRGPYTTDPRVMQRGGSITNQ